MRGLSTRLRLAIWLVLVVLVLAVICLFVAYNAVEDMIAEQIGRSLERDSAMVASHIHIRHGLPVFDGVLSYGMHHTVFAADHRWAGGDDMDWMNAIPKTTTGRIHYVRRPEGGWRFYDTDLHADGEYIGFVRLFVGPNQYIDDAEEMRYVAFYLFLMFIALVIVLLGSLWITGHALKSLKKITATAVEIGAGDLSKRIHWTGSRDEIGILAHTLDNMADSLEKAFEWEKQFTSDVSHEIRTPIASIIANAENAEYRDDLEVYRASIQNILVKGRQMQEVIKQLLLLAREREQGRQLTLEEFDLDIVLKDIADEIREQAGERAVSVETEVVPHLRICADLTLFTRLMINLVSNALKYGKEGGYIRIRAEDDEAHNRIRISVRDNGIGISKEDLPHIFQRFYRADKSRSDGSAGLGLAFAEMIVHLHGGGIRVESEPGVGSCFMVELPKYHGLCEARGRNPVEAGD